MKYAHPAFWIPCFLVLSLLTAAACAREKAPESREEIKVYRSGSLKAAGKTDAGTPIYIDAQAEGKPSRELGRDLEKALRAGDFKIASSPSKAGYILHVSLLSEGEVAPGALQSLVDAGYGAGARFTGGGAKGALADALLVQRNAPRGERRAHLKNISRRNAVGSGRMRLGLLASGTGSAGPALANALAREIKAAISPGAEASAGE